ncbi:MAG: hypothetical protein AVDCRST_MAG47-2012, partial [uncultured Nocardioidaceae bacterium]
ARHPLGDDQQVTASRGRDVHRLGLQARGHGQGGGHPSRRAAPGGHRDGLGDRGPRQLDRPAARVLPQQPEAARGEHGGVRGAAAADGRRRRAAGRQSRSGRRRPGAVVEPRHRRRPQAAGRGEEV